MSDINFHLPKSLKTLGENLENKYLKRLKPKSKPKSKTENMTEKEKLKILRKGAEKLASQKSASNNLIKR